MFFRFLFFILLICSFTLNSVAQDNAGPPKKDQSIKSKRKQRKAAKKKWKDDRRNKRLEEKKIKDHHKRIQTKTVRKRMKRSKKTALRNHDNKRTPFFERAFKKKGGKARKSKEKVIRP